MAELKNGIRTFHPKTVASWRKWLEKNHESESKVWLIIYHKDSSTASIYYNEAVEQALCFGWIDSTAHNRDSESSYLYFAKRKPNSKWSKINRERVARLEKQKLIHPSGKKMIDLAKQTGTWELLDKADPALIPEDLQKLFDRNKKAEKNFEAFPPSSRRMILEWIMNAKRSETREARLKETVELAAKNIRANHYIPKPRASK